MNQHKKHYRALLRDLKTNLCYEQLENRIVFDVATAELAPLLGDLSSAVVMESLGAAPWDDPAQPSPPAPSPIHRSRPISTHPDQNVSSIQSSTNEKPHVLHGSVPMQWNGETRQVMPGSWVAHLSQSVDLSDEGAYLGAPKLTDPELVVTELIGRQGWFHIQAPQSYDSEQLSAVITSQLPLLSLQPELADYSEMMIPNDLYYPGEGSLIQHIQAPQAWGQTEPDQGSTSVVVAVNDTGVDYTHPDLYRNIWLNQNEIPVGLVLVDTDGDGLITFWDLNEAANSDVVTDLNVNGYIDAGDLLRPITDGGWDDEVDGGGNGYVDDLVGWDFAHDDNDPFPYDENFDNIHGTHVAGTIGATGNDGVGIAGIAWKTQLMLASGLDEFGFGTDVALAGAIDYAVANGARITNASWGGPYSELIDISVQGAAAANHLVIAAAGNDGTDNDASPDFSYPSVLPYDNIIAVTGVDEFDFPAFTNYGAISVDLAAPSNILSTVPSWFLPGEPAYLLLGGSSMATAVVTGAATLLWSTLSSATLADIRSVILSSVDLIPDLDPLFGYSPVATGGRLNVFNALQALSPDTLHVVSSVPNEGETVFGIQPTEYSVTFSSPVVVSNDPADLQAADFTVSGVPAEAVTLTEDGLTATFFYSSPPITTEGPVTLAIAPEAIQRADHLGSLRGGFNSTIRYDQILLSAESIDPAEGHIFEAAEFYSFHIHFNEPVDIDSLFRSPYEDPNYPFSDHIYLSFDGPVIGSFSNFSEISLSETDLDVTFPQPFDGELTFRLVLEAGLLLDLNGNPNGYNEFTYTIDVTTQAYPTPISTSAPLGAGIAVGATRLGTVNAGFATPDTDDFTLNLDVGQSMTVQILSRGFFFRDLSELLLNLAPTLQPSLQVYDPNNVLIASNVAPTIGGRAILVSIPIEITGTFTIRVSGANETVGDYQMQLVLNAALETEGRLFRSSNDLVGLSQSLDGSFQSYSTGLTHIERAAVSGALGNVNDGTSNATVLFSADFEAGTDGFTFTDDFEKTGLWNRTDRRGNDPGHSATHSMWYGNPETGTYDLGGAGSILSPAILLPNTSTPLSFDFKYFLESDSNGRSAGMSVYIHETFDGGETFILHQFVGNQQQTEGAWTKSSLFDLSSYKGRMIKIGVQFFTLPGFDPSLEGLYVDDFKVYQNAQSVDYYSFTGTAGEKIGFDIVQFSGSVIPDLLRVELIGTDQSTVLTTGTVGATNMLAAANGLTVPSNGTYYLRVTSPRLQSGVSGIISYNLLVTRNSVFDLEGNSSAATAQPLLGTEGAFGYIEPMRSNVVDSGWYNSAGDHSRGAPNYVTGQGFSSGTLMTFRSFFVFDVPATIPNVTSASIAVFNPSRGYISPDASETYKLFDVATPITTLRAGGTGLTGIFDDLGTGVEFGSVEISAASNGTLVSINLNAAGIAAIQAARGGQIAFGGALSSLSGTSQQLVFGFSSGSSVRTLIINGSPDPADWYSVSLGSEQTALRLETRAVWEGPGELRNVLNPRVELYNQDGTTKVASGQVMADGKNEFILISGLTPNSNYLIRVSGEAGSVGEYVLTAKPLVVPKVALPVSVGDGTNQRSNVKSLSVTFDGVVDISNLNSGTFVVKQRGNTGGVVASTATSAIVNSRTVVTLTFNGQFTEANGSLKDGNYDLKIDASRISRNGLALDGNRDGTAGGDFLFGANPNGSILATDNFFRMFGDADGDRDVDDADRDVFNRAFRKPVNIYTAMFDFDGDLDVDGLDLSQFSRRYRKSLPLS